MFEKDFARPLFPLRASTSRPLSEATEMYDTEFEEDLSDVEDYSGRRSEDSVCQERLKAEHRANTASSASGVSQQHRRMTN